jgi:hypothetical protein
VVTPVRPFRLQREKRSNIAMMRWLLTGQHSAWYYIFRKRPCEEIWAEHCDAVVQHHIRRDPGSRPRLWWWYSAPEPRQRLGGIGSPLHEVCNHRAPFEYGVPSAWRFAGDHMDACGVPLSADDPPIYESEASYLKRLGLFVSGERKRIHRVDFSPVAIRIVDGYIGEYRVGLQ